jgi:hypothetical protein
MEEEKEDRNSSKEEDSEFSETGSVHLSFKKKKKSENVRRIHRPLTLVQLFFEGFQQRWGSRCRSSIFQRG